MKEIPNEQDSLRAAAEAKLARAHAPKQMQRPPEEILHELQVHQIELEMQNEQLLQLQVELKKSLDCYVDFYDMAPVGYLTLSREEMIDKANLTGAALLGVERNELPHHRFAPFVATEDLDRWHRHFQNVLKRDDTATCELALQRRDGSRFFGQLDCLRLSKADKTPAVRIVLTDITERKRAEDVVRTQEEFFRMIVENIDDFLAVLDLEGRRLYNSPSYAKLFGSIEAMKGTDSFAEIHPDDMEGVRQAFRETVRSGRSHRLNFRFVLADGSIHYMESCGALIRNSLGQALRVVVVSRDVTERIREEDKIRNLAFYDALTQLPNRRLLNDRLDQAMAASKRSGRYGALLFLDLDNFKPLNDRYGHSVGDLLLVEVARRIASCVREMDTVARFGGDEFVVVLSELNENNAESIAQAEIVAQKINAVLSESYVPTVQKDGKETTTIEHHCTSSIGVAIFINHEVGAENIIKWADIAMYQAKEAGGNRVWFYDAKA